VAGDLTAIKEEKLAQSAEDGGKIIASNIKAIARNANVTIRLALKSRLLVSF